jgi:hypothetical protein
VVQAACAAWLIVSYFASRGSIFDGREAAESSLPAPPVIGPFDPDDDRQAQLLAGGPALTVQDVLLQQGEERLHRGVIAAGTDPAHRPGQPMVFKSGDERRGPELLGFRESSQHLFDGGGL